MIYNIKKIMNTLFKIIGKRIAQKRRLLKYSQEKLAEIAGLHRTYIGFIERGEKEVRIATLLKITKVLKIKLEELFKDF